MKRLNLTYTLTACVVAMLVLAVWFTAPVTAQLDRDQAPAPRGPFAISAGENGIAWRIDRKTGAVSYCQRGTSSMDRTIVESRPPYCSPWGN